MTEFQALITGAVSGALIKASAEGPFLIHVEVGTDGENYTNEIFVTGRESGEQLVIRVEPRYDTPESVAEKMEGVKVFGEQLEIHLSDQLEARD